MRIPELLAPAGNMERLKGAFRFGADAVYVGMQRMSLRNFADNFTIDTLSEGCDFAHAIDKRVYVAVNAFAHDKELSGLSPFLRDVEAAGADALIVNDPGVLSLAREAVPNMELHLSTQANTLNTYSAKLWHELGVKRIVLARELSLSEVKTIKDNIPTLELEMFVHGAMCVSYSGRCLLSNYITGRDSNKGECAQPCRWSYEMRERGRDGQYFTIEQDDKGTHIMNAEDMNMLPILPDVLATGVHSLKIEGRMKSIYYVAATVNAYRMALDAYKESLESGTQYKCPDGVIEETYKVSHRPYSTGFAQGEPNQATLSSNYISESTLLGKVLDYDPVSKRALIEQRNRFYDGETMSILSPGDILRTFSVNGIWDAKTGEKLTVCPHPKQQIHIGCDEIMLEGDILRSSV